MPIHNSPIMHFQMSNLAFSLVHPWTVWLDRGLGDKEVLLGLIPLCMSTRLLTRIVSVDPIFWNPILLHDLIEDITAIGLALHWHNGSPIFIIAK